jgi:hypothetical protein
MGCLHVEQCIVAFASTQQEAAVELVGDSDTCVRSPVTPGLDFSAVIVMA